MEPGAATGLTFDLRHAHLFDGASGRRIEARPVTGSVTAVAATFSRD